MTTPKDLKPEHIKRQDKKNNKARSTEAMESSKKNCLVDLESPKGSQETPKSTQMEPQEAPKTRFASTTLILQMMCSLKSKCLRIGRSSWMPKIGPQKEEARR